MKQLAAALGAALLVLAAPPVSVSARSLDDYYYEEDDIPYGTDNGYEDYYRDGVVYDSDGVVHVGGGSVSMKVGEIKNLAEGRSYHSSDKDLEISVVSDKRWASQNPDIASVDSKGVVTAHRIGSTRITVSYSDNRGYRIAQAIRLTVGSGNASGSSGAAKNYFEITEGKRICLEGLLPDEFTAGDVLWETGNDKIAAVDSEGLVTARSIGSCKITATHTGEDGAVQTAKFSVRVTSGLLENRSRDIRVSIPAGKTVDVVKLLYPNYADTGSILKAIQCTTGDASVAGLRGHEVTGLKKGSCTVTVCRYDGYEIKEQERISVYVTD